jgi:hypothetical protein
MRGTKKRGGTTHMRRTKIMQRRRKTKMRRMRRTRKMKGGVKGDNDPIFLTNKYGNDFKLWYNERQKDASIFTRFKRNFTTETLEDKFKKSDKYDENDYEAKQMRDNTNTKANKIYSENKYVITKDINDLAKENAKSEEDAKIKAEKKATMDYRKKRIEEKIDEIEIGKTEKEKILEDLQREGDDNKYINEIKKKAEKKAESLWDTNLNDDYRNYKNNILTDDNMKTSGLFIRDNKTERLEFFEFYYKFGKKNDGIRITTLPLDEVCIQIKNETKLETELVNEICSKLKVDKEQFIKTQSEEIYKKEITDEITRLKNLISRFEKEKEEKEREKINLENDDQTNIQAQANDDVAWKTLKKPPSIQGGKKTRRKTRITK